MARPKWSQPLPRPLVIPGVIPRTRARYRRPKMTQPHSSLSNPEVLADLFTSS